MSAALKRYTVDEYLAIEEHSDFRHEFYDGELYAMAGGTARHTVISINIAAELRGRLRGQECTVFGSDMKVLCPDGLYAYPDASVCCGEPEYVNKKQTVLTNPTLLVEVLSDSTEGYDRGSKFDFYKSIGSFQDYLLVRQDQPLVSHFIRQSPNAWLNYSLGLNDSLVVQRWGLELPVSEVYYNVAFGQPAGPEVGGRHPEKH